MRSSANDCLAVALAPAWGGNVRALESPSASRRPSRRGEANAGTSVLVVDDDKDIRESLAQVLADEGFRVKVAANGLEALEEIARTPPDVVLLDLMMPIVTGWEVLDRLARAGSKVPVIVLSACDAQVCVDVIRKPIELSNLLDLLSLIRERASDSQKMRAARRAFSPRGGN